MSFGRARVLACSALFAGVVAVTVDVIARGPLQRLDLVVSETLPASPGTAAWWFWWLLAQMGNQYVLIPPLGVCCLLASARLRSFHPVVVAFLTCVGLVLLVPAFKIATGRTAPRSGFDAVFAGASSYPSGHAVNAIVIWGSALEMAVLAFPVLAAWLTLRVRRTLVVVWSTAAGLGMVMLDYHWLTDALAGWMLGALLFLVLLGLDAFTPRQRPPRVGGGTRARDRRQERPGRVGG